MPDDPQCPIVRSLARVGDSWSILILREAFYGETRFDAFQRNLGIAPNMLTRRLRTLVEAGVLERHRYCEHPPRCEYLLTERGRDFRPVLLTLLAWGNRHFAPEGESLRLVRRGDGVPVDPVLVDGNTGQRITAADHAIAAGPAAGEPVRARMARRAGAGSGTSPSRASHAGGGAATP